MLVIADSLQSQFCDCCHLLKNFTDRLTIGCHGLHHKSWSAWPEDSDLFQDSIKQVILLISDFTKANFRPWFRAPAGYMAPWMVQPLVDCKITVDSSINDTLLTKSKSEKAIPGSKFVMKTSEIMEREWLTNETSSHSFPALSKFPLSVIAKSAWKLFHHHEAK